MEINLKETSWERTCRDSKKWLLDHILAWILAFIFPGVGSVIASYFIPNNPSIELSALYGFLGGCIGLILLLFIVYNVQLIKAPYKQRNEARIKVKEFEIKANITPDAPRIAKAELHFAPIRYHFISNNPLNIGIEFEVSTTGDMLLEVLEIEISGNRERCKDWESDSIAPGVSFSYAKSHELSKGLTNGEHDIRLLIYANKEWWASDWETINYNPSSLTN